MNEPNSLLSHPRQLWLESITLLVNVASFGAGLLEQTWVNSTCFKPTSETIHQHEGRHPLLNPRYKEWWYWDGHGRDGFVISLAVVHSLVKPHVFLWIHNPLSSDNQVQQILTELIMDCQVLANDWCGDGINLSSTNLHIVGSSSRKLHA